ncbi:MAG: bacteriohemerythrin [Magnetospirillum sp. WYHS-4]
MPAVSWTDDLSVGVHVVDADHKMLIDLINQVVAAAESKRPHDQIAKVLVALDEYVDFHFVREESMMEACGYAGLDDHRKVHEKLRTEVHNIAEHFKREPAKALTDEVLAFLTQWLVRHIMGHDKNYAPAMVGKEQQIAEAHRAFLHHGSYGESADATDAY